jgi:hypothetical protein
MYHAKQNINYSDVWGYKWKLSKIIVTLNICSQKTLWSSLSTKLENKFQFCLFLKNHWKCCVMSFWKFFDFLSHFLLMSGTSWLLSSLPLKSEKLPFDLDPPDLKGEDYDFWILSAIG